MVKMSVPGKQFLENYSDVLRHHVICILDSGMVLDEDMNLLQTFWDPSLMEISLGSRHRFLLTSTTFAATGLLAAAKCRSVYPLAICLIPTTLRVLKRVVTCCRGQRYKKNFEKLLLLLRTMFDLVKKIVQYYSKRDIAVQNCTLQLEAFNILFRPGEEFLKHGIMVVIGVVEVLKMSMLQICELVPIPEGQFLCSTELNLDSFKMFESFAEMKTQFEKLIDLYLLIMSNFLGCLGLSMCVQLWKQPCSFQDILDKLIPDLNTFLQKTVNDVKGKFNLIRYNLCEGAEFKKTINARAPDHFQKPLAELLVNVQIMFENCKRLQYLLEDEHHNTNYTQFDTILKAIANQMETSKDYLSILNKWTEVLNKQANCVFTEKSPSHSHDTVSILSEEAHIDRDSNEIVELKDEEYNLSIHDSQDDYDDSMSDVDYLDHFVPNENIDIVLLELKKKLEEFQKKNEPLREESKKLPQLQSPPVVTHSREVNSLLRTVMLTAQTINRSEEFQFGFNMFPEVPRPFNTTYKCFSVAMFPGNERQDVERGGKIIMPPSALEHLTRLNVNYPMQFKIVNKKTNRTSHCGVLEFVADEGKVYLPLWLMQNLVLEEGDLIQIENVSLPVGTFAKFQPLSSDFLDITNPKAVLENCLRTFSSLTSGDVIAVKYNQRVYELCVLETQPGNAISIIECDMNVEFAPPVGYKETAVAKPTEEGMAVDPTDMMPEPSGFVAFGGQGNRLDGKRRKDSGSSETATARPVYIRGIPDYDYQIGTLRFLRQTTKSATNNKDENGAFKAFSGEGFSLKQRN